MLIGQYFPAWYLGHFPEHRIIYTSYEADFAASWGRKARNVLEEWGGLFGVKVSPESSAANRWDLEGHAGGMNTAGVNGPITGKGANVFVIDDPVKNDQQAESRLYQERTFDWYRSVARTRLRKDGAIILVMTRWNERDLAGRLLQAAEEGGEEWTILSLPALAEGGDPLGRAEGEVLCPALHDKQALLETRNTLGSYWWNALFQQRPQPAGGTIFQREWFRYFRTDGEFYVLMRAGGEHRVKRDDCWRFQTVDLAASLKSSADYFVVQTWAVTPERDLLLLDLLRTRVEGPQQLGLLKQQYHRHRPSFIGIERAGYQLTMLQTAIREGLPARELKADRDKVSRALTIAARYEAGAVYHRAGAPWLQDYEDELLAFPRGGHDDMVDCAGYAGLVLADTAKRVIDKVVVV